MVALTPQMHTSGKRLCVSKKMFAPQQKASMSSSPKMKPDESPLATHSHALSTRPTEHRMHRNIFILRKCPQSILQFKPRTNIKIVKLLFHLSNASNWACLHAYLSAQIQPMNMHWVASLIVTMFLLQADIQAFPCSPPNKISTKKSVYKPATMFFKPFW